MNMKNFKAVLVFRNKQQQQRNHTKMGKMSLSSFLFYCFNVYSFLIEICCVRLKYNISSPWSSPGQNTGVVAFPFSRGSSQSRDRTQVSHCRWILYHLSHQWSPRILEWVAYPFSSVSSRPRDWTRVSRIVGRRFTVWATRDISCICATNIVLEVFTHLFLHIKCFHSLKQQLKATTKRWKLGTSETYY